MTHIQTIIENGEFVGCPDIDAMKRWFWASAESTASENFLFCAAAYYTATGLMRGSRDEARTAFLINECILNRFSGLYLNVTHQLRNAAQGIASSGQYGNLGLVLPVLAGASEEAQHFLYNNGQITSRVNSYSQTTKKRTKTKRWLQIFYGAKSTHSIQVQTKVGKFSRSTSKDNVDALRGGWGDAPWLRNLGAMT